MHPHKQIIERIGRTKDVAHSLGIPSQHVSIFKRRGIPWKYRNQIVELADFKLPGDFLKP